MEKAVEYVGAFGNISIAVCCMIIMFAATLLVGIIGNLMRIKAKNNKGEVLPFYSVSVIVYIALSFVALYYYIKVFDAAVISQYMEIDRMAIESGFVFAILTVIAGWVVRGVYGILRRIFNRLFHRQILYKINDNEVKWSFVLVCTALTVVCFMNGDRVGGYTFIVFLIGKFLWLDFNRQSLSDELESLKKLSVSYWFVILFIIMCAVAFHFCADTVSVLYAAAGIIAGMLLATIILGLKNVA